MKAAAPWLLRVFFLCLRYGGSDVAIVVFVVEAAAVKLKTNANTIASSFAAGFHHGKWKQSSIALSLCSRSRVSFFRRGSVQVVLSVLLFLQGRRRW